MRIFLVCLLVVALLGFVFAEPKVEKRFIEGLKKAFNDAAKTINDAIDDANLGQKLGQTKDKIQDAADKVLDTLGDVAGNIKDGITGF
ncbi:hypothetical protein ElyMa_005836600 [Elysia marginata]|uniref:Uncharacterized protein n=1 Tax=Elysia marginata TaxID=1093978 RepID=A0AAV4FX60_9GAST|nr:hypothetical protein ElyMa_005836600 [Elysia marginata]